MSFLSARYISICWLPVLDELLTFKSKLRVKVPGSYPHELLATLQLSALGRYMVSAVASLTNIVLFICR